MSIENTHFGADRIGKMLADCHSVFFIGIGGISMSALAQMALADGMVVGGSDRQETDLTRELAARGVSVFVGHDASRIRNYDAVVYTVAIGADNPEYLAAAAQCKPLLSRADYLGYLMCRFQNRIGVAGMHGKSTATAMCSSIFLSAGDPTVFCGAELKELKNNTCRIGKSREHFVFEACEYMDSFLDFNPTLALVLNIGMDHVDYFHSMEQIHASFRAFAARAGRNGILLWNADDAESCEAFADPNSLPSRTVTYGICNPADFTARNVKMRAGILTFDFYRDENRLCELTVHATGAHNVSNALAAASAAVLCGIDCDAIQKGLSRFMGAGRRMERKGTLNGAVVYDDYGHHPDEIRATLAGAGQLGARRVLCAFQPHTYSRTAGLLDEFAGAFDNADRVYMVDIYAAREKNTFGVTSAHLAERIGTKALYTGSFEETARAIRTEAKEGDLVVIMGAGDIYRVFDYLDLNTDSETASED